MTPLPLFERFPALAHAVPWTPIVHTPTPIEMLAGLAERRGLANLYVKREDKTHPVVGGNKVRGLEFLLADAKRRNADTLVTFGAVGSNHVAATAHHGRQLGFNTTAFVMAQPHAAYVPRNLADGIAARARLIPINPITAAPKVIAEWLRLRLCKTRCRWIPPGGTTPLACLGHVNAALELREQIDAGVLPEPDYLIVGMGSLGTAAGLMLGCKLARLRTRIMGVVVFHRWFCTPGRCAALARRTLRFMMRHDPSILPVNIEASDFDVVGTALGKGYAHATDSSAALTRELIDSGELTLDAAYTSKTLSGGLAWIEQQEHRNKTVLYWHTFHARPALEGAESQRVNAALPGAIRPYIAPP